ncbi:winged helix-turn-helix domain-containing protein [Streptomyces hirsutus]|uniref:ArsR/SmtB family transcription factor n=1 Tax=Streptomyces hirsutus TaxID=35620 RepID=UPI0033C90603
MPSPFCDHAVTVVDLALPPRIRYPARGLATGWHTDTTTPPTAPPTAPADLLGRTRARILGHLAQPTSTTEPAQRLGVTPGTVSRHLGVLHRTGLVTRARHGHLVLYLRSPLGDRLLM